MSWHKLKLFLVALILASFSYSITNPDNDNDSGDDYTPSWYSFDWLASDGYSGLENPRSIMRVSFEIGGIGSSRGFQLCLDVRENYIYESYFDDLLWRKPGFEDNVISLQGAGRTRRRVLEEAGLTIRGDTLGHADFNVIEGFNEPENVEVSGFIGYDFFRATRKIVAIDHKSSQVAFMDKLPEKWKEKAHLIDMGSSPSFLSLRVRANRSRISLSFDGEPTPALILYRRWDFQRLALNESVEDSLKYSFPRSDEHMMLGGYKPQRDLYFGPYKLKSHNVYRMPEKDHRIGGEDGLISQAFFEDYILILDYRRGNFGIVPPSVLDN